MPAETFTITVANTGLPGDPLCETLRVQELARQLARRLGLAVVEVRAERLQERRERRARRDGVGGYNAGGRR
jgi:hypothetical protein